VLPLNLGIGLLFFDGLDGFATLFFFAVDHDHFHACVGECAADFISVLL
jgi:hypothetical protein